MANAIFAIVNYLDIGSVYSPTLSGGSWQASLPLANLQARRPRQYARSTNDDLTSTKLNIDLGVARDVRVVAFPWQHNLSRAAKVRITAATDSGFSNIVTQTAWLDVFKVVYPMGSRPWGSAGLWDGKLTAEEWADGHITNFVHVFNSPVIARYWRLEIDDTTNPAGYVELGRLWISGAYQPSLNIQYDASIAWNSLTTREDSDGGSSFFDERGQRRVATFTIGDIPEDEAFVNLFGIQRRHGLSKQFMFILNPAATHHMADTSFLAVMRELQPFEFPYFRRNTTAFAIIEEL